MKTTLKLKLTPDAQSGQLLRRTLEACNAEANRISRIAHERKITNKHDLQKVVYGESKAALGSAQPVCLTVSKVHGAYKTHRGNIRNGNLGKKNSARRAKAEAAVLDFRADAAQPYDARCLSIRPDKGEVSIWVIDTGDGTPGRITVGFTCWERHLDTLRSATKIAESDLVKHSSGWFLHVTVESPTPEPSLPAQTTAEDWIGVDLGLENLAYDSDANCWLGEHMDFVRERYLHNRQWAQRLKAQPNNRTALRRLKTWSGRERRFAADTNHRIAKEIVELAYRTGRGVALEQLEGIRTRARHRKPQRTRFHSWAFRQLAEFIVYKAAAFGVPVVFVDPAYTSQDCHVCGNRDKRARTSQATYVCTRLDCAYAGHADHNGAMNILARAPQAWAESMGEELSGQAVSHAVLAA